MFGKIIGLSMIAVMLGLAACSRDESTGTVIKVGTIAGPETSLMEVAKREAASCYGLDVDIVTFTDYNTPNVALNDGSIGANMFQHVPYLDAQVKARGYKIVAVGRTFIYPMGLYSNTLTSLDQLQDGAKVAIPNDPSNEARALLLLEEAKLIKLKPKASVMATTLDITANPKKLQFVTLDAAQLPRALSDVVIAAINTNYAIPAGYSLSEALAKEGADSLYANVVVARDDDANSMKVKQLVSALHSTDVIDAAKRIFGDAAIPAWNLKDKLMPCTAK